MHKMCERVWALRFHCRLDCLSAVVCRQSCIYPWDRISGCWCLLTFLSHSSLCVIFLFFLSISYKWKQILKKSISNPWYIMQSRHKLAFPFAESLSSDRLTRGNIFTSDASTYCKTDINLPPDMPADRDWKLQNSPALTRLYSKCDQEAKCWPLCFYFIARLCIFVCRTVDWCSGDKWQRPCQRQLPSVWDINSCEL